MQDGINNNTTYEFNTVSSSKDNMYYSNSDTAKPTLESWYQTSIIEKGYSSNVATGNYFCEEAKVAYHSDYATNSGSDMKVYNDGYTPNFTCEKNGKDGNGKGLVNTSVGLLTYDEVIHAGGYYGNMNDNYYLYNNTIYWWTMGPAGFSGSTAYVWRVDAAGTVHDNYVNSTRYLRPVINLKADTVVTGAGTSASPYKVKVQEDTSLTVGTAVTAIDGSKWHVLETSGSDSKYVTLLSDYNLNSDGTYNTTCGRDINSTYVCSPMAFDTTNSNIYDEGSSTNIGYFIKNTYSPLVLASLTGTTNITLPTAKQIAAVENKTFEQAHLSLTTTWLTTTNYWTKTEHTTNLNDVWDIDGSNSYIYSYYANSDLYIGIRPVITTLKTNLILN